MNKRSMNFFLKTLQSVIENTLTINVEKNNKLTRIGFKCQIHNKNWFFHSEGADIIKKMQTILIKKRQSIFIKITLALVYFHFKACKMLSKQVLNNLINLKTYVTNKCNRCLFVFSYYYCYCESVC